MDMPRKLTLKIGNFTCTIEGFENPDPVVAAVTGHLLRTMTLAPTLGEGDIQTDLADLAMDVARKAGPGIKLSGDPHNPTIRPADQSPPTRVVQVKRNKPAPKVMDVTPPDLNLFNPTATLTPLGGVKGLSRRDGDVDSFEWREPQASPDNLFAAPTETPPPAMDPSAPAHPDQIAAAALEKAMSQPVRTEHPSGLPSAMPLLSLKDYAAPRRPRRLEEAIEIAAAYRHFILSETVFRRGDVLATVDEIALKDGPFAADAKLRVFNALAEAHRFTAQDRGAFSLSAEMIRQFSR